MVGGPAVWHHLSLRRLAAGPGRGLWDDVRGPFPELDAPPPAGPPWRCTARVVEALVAAADVLAQELLAEWPGTAAHLAARALAAAERAPWQAD